MKPILFGDTETQGIPFWQLPSDDPSQPHIVQLAALLVDFNREVIGSMDVIIRPDGWVIPEETIAVHGITMERAMDEGIPEDEALDMYLALYAQCGLRVFHNSTFDNRMLRIAMKRYRPDAVAEEVWKDKAAYHCTMVSHTKIHGGKWPKLTDLYRQCFGREMEGAHSAMGDTRACMEIYYHALDAQAAAA